MYEHWSKSIEKQALHPPRPPAADGLPGPPGPGPGAHLAGPHHEFPSLVRAAGHLVDGLHRRCDDARETVGIQFPDLSGTGPQPVGSRGRRRRQHGVYPGWRTLLRLSGLLRPRRLRGIPGRMRRGCFPDGEQPHPRQGEERAFADAGQIPVHGAHPLYGCSGRLRRGPCNLAADRDGERPADRPGQLYLRDQYGQSFRLAESPCNGSFGDRRGPAAGPPPGSRFHRRPPPLGRRIPAAP